MHKTGRSLLHFDTYAEVVRKLEVSKQPYLLILLRKYNVKVAPIYSRLNKSALP
jgi:hypothetical protein